MRKTWNFNAVFHIISRSICHISISLTALVDDRKRHCVFLTRLKINSATDSPKSRWLTSDPHNVPLNVWSSLPTVKKQETWLPNHWNKTIWNNKFVVIVILHTLIDLATLKALSIMISVVWRPWSSPKNCRREIWS